MYTCPLAPQFPFQEAATLFSFFLVFSLRSGLCNQMEREATMGNDIRRGPKTFPLNTSQPQGRPLLSPFLEPGLASLKSKHPPALSEWVWRSRREGSAVLRGKGPILHSVPHFTCCETPWPLFFLPVLRELPLFFAAA